MIARFFIDRPIFAAVLSIVITLAGGVAVRALPLALYPPVSPPLVQVDCNYPGASAQVVAESVATPIEQQVNGVENMLYMSSQCTNDGSYNLSVTFKHGVDLNMAQVLVQNRVSLALPNLPDVIKQTGVTTRKKSPDILMAIAINSPGCELKLMPGLKDVSELPTRGKDLAVVAEVNKALHIRVFGSNEKIAKDFSESDLPEKARVINDLKQQLESVWPLHHLTGSEEAGVISMALSIVGYKPPADVGFDQLYLSNYALMHIKEELARVPGVSDVTMLGQRDYAMRIWLDPDKLAARNLTAGDVVSAIRDQNQQVATGQIGQQPAPRGQVLQVPLTTLGRLIDVQHFENIVLRITPDSRYIRIKDVGRVELGAKNQDIKCLVNGKPSATLAVFQLPDANALDTAVMVKEKMEELYKDFPPGLGYEIRYDTTPYISESILEVFKTLRDAIVLVAIVVLLFLQNWRSALIPLIAVPVAIIGSFGVLAVFGFSLNNLTLFGLVLAIGIVVDDAIVVVEAVEHHIEHGLPPRAATICAMHEVSGPVIAIGLVLSAVFIPCAFISGIVGQFFRQFALTIASSTIISAINSLTLSPALAALLLRPKSREQKFADPLPRAAFALLGGWAAFEYLTPRLAPRLGELLAARAPSFAANAGMWPAWVTAVGAGVLVGWVVSRPLNRLLGGFFAVFNFGFRFGTKVYTRVVGIMLRVSFLVLLGYGGLLYLTYDGFKRAPAGFIPSQDMGYLLINVQLPDSASAERTDAVMEKISSIARRLPGVRHTQTMAGMSFLLSANGSNFGSMFIILDDFSKRAAPSMRGDAIQAKLRELYAAEVPEAMLTVLGPPPVRGVGRAGGFKVMVEDRGDNGVETLQGQTENLVDKLKEDKRLVSLVSVFRANVPQLYVNLNRVESMTKEVGLKDFFDTLRIYLGSLYVNDFNKFGRTWQVIVQADHHFRNRVDGVRRLKVRNAEGAMVPLGALADIEERNGPLIIIRYNMYPAAPVNGSAAPGVSSGTAIKIVEQKAHEQLLSSMATEWTELAYLELQAGNTAMIIFGFAVVMVFLVLAAQYESWSLPLAVILVVPLCLLSGVTGVRLDSQDINIFTQIGFVVLVGLACKNAILIVEFAKHRREAGETRRQATLDACQLRLRPIIMTSLAFILGVVPLIIGHGAGAEMRHTLGITVFSGMLGVTAFGVFLTPVFFFVIDWLGGTQFFASRTTRRVGKIALYVLTLGILPLITVVPRMLFRELRRRPVPPPKKINPDPELAEPHEFVEQK